MTRSDAETLASAVAYLASKGATVSVEDARGESAWGNDANPRSTWHEVITEAAESLGWTPPVAAPVDAGSRSLSVYVASSWRNEHQPGVVAALRADGIDVYDFRHPAAGDDGFAWREVEAAAKPWDAAMLTRALAHPRSAEAFASDFGGMRAATACVLVLPCGKSAHLEAGWLAARGCPLVVFMPEPSEPELMYRLAPGLRIVSTLDAIAPALRALSATPPQPSENAKIRAMPEAERAAAVEDARARGVFDGEGREPADYTDLMRTAATMPGFVRACMKLKEASERAETAERERDVLLADWREIDALPAVHAAFVEGMKLSDAVAAALADVHYAEGTPLFDAEIAKREAEAERDEARAELVELREAAAGVRDGWATSQPHVRLRAALASTPAAPRGAPSHRGRGSG